MKKYAVMFTILVCLFAFASVVLAEDVVLDTKVERVLLKKDKNGAPYARILVATAAELNGVQYSKTVSAMCFGDTYAPAAKLKKGDTLKAIAAKGEFRGNTSYQIRKFLP